MSDMIKRAAEAAACYVASQTQIEDRKMERGEPWKRPCEIIDDAVAHALAALESHKDPSGLDSARQKATDTLTGSPGDGGGSTFQESPGGEVAPSLATSDERVGSNPAPGSPPITDADREAARRRLTGFSGGGKWSVLPHEDAITAYLEDVATARDEEREAIIDLQEQFTNLRGETVFGVPVDEIRARKESR